MYSASIRNDILDRAAESGTRQYVVEFLQGYFPVTQHGMVRLAPLSARVVSELRDITKQTVYC